MTESTTRLPGCIGALVLLAAGIGAGVWVFSRSLDRLDAALTPLDVPGGGTVTLPEPGVYRVYLERPMEETSPEALEASEREIKPDALDVTVRAPGGESIAPALASVEEAYYLKGRSGQAILEFDAPGAGEYVVETAWRGESPPDFSLALAHGALPRFMGQIFAGMGIIVVVGLIAGAWGLRLLSRGGTRQTTGNQ